MNDTAFLVSRLKKGKKKKKKKRSTYWPSQFSGQKGKQTFSFLGLMVLQNLSVNTAVGKKLGFPLFNILLARNSKEDLVIKIIHIFL